MSAVSIGMFRRAKFQGADVLAGKIGHATAVMMKRADGGGEFPFELVILAPAARLDEQKKPRLGQHGD